MKTMGDRIRDLRLERRWTMKQLAEKAGISKSHISRLESGKRAMTGSIQKNLATAFNMSVIDLFKGITDESIYLQYPSEIKRNIKDSGININAKYNLLSNKIFSNTLIPILIELQKKEKTTPEKSFKIGEGFVYVLEGSVEIELEKEKHLLQKDEHCFFNTCQDYIFKGVGGGTNKILYVTTKAY